MFCRAGEKRSVAVALLLKNVLESLEGCRVLASYLCKYFWHRRTCFGDKKACKWCHLGGADETCEEAALARTRAFEEAAMIYNSLNIPWE